MVAVVAIDLGLVRTGVALGDERIGIAHPFEIWSTKEAETKLLELIKQRSIEVLVIGVALNEDGSGSKMSQKSKLFAKRIGKRAKIKTMFVDEYGSSVDSEERFLESNISGKATDAHAAAEILQRYFNSRT